MTILFLYTEISDYFLKSCNELSKSNDVIIIRWPKHSNAPFDYEYSEKIKIYNKSDYKFDELKELVLKINPDILICSGWIDKQYLKITKFYFKKIPTVLTCDTAWKNTIKQYLALILSQFFLLNTFSHAWVAGEAQKIYLHKLGFKLKNIYLDFYCCNLLFFNSVYIKNLQKKINNYPKRFLFIGRYFDFKGITDLWSAFIKLQEEEPNEWELWCLGAGDIKPIVHPKIKHFGFIQPKLFESILENTGVFILPSRIEPWGVVVQECAAAGFPLILSDSVGSKEIFFEAEKNGYLFNSGNIEQLKKIMINIIHKDESELIEMGRQSNIMAQKINQLTWVNSLMKIHTEFLIDKKHN